MKKLFLTGILLMSVLTALAGCGGGNSGNGPEDGPGDGPKPKSWVVSTFSDYTGPGWGMAFDSTNNMFVADYTNHRIIRINTAGTSSVLANDLNYLNTPRGIALDAADNIYYCNDFAHDIIKLTPAVSYSLYAGTKGDPGSSNSDAPPVKFNRPFGVALNRTSQILYVADSENMKIRKIDLTNGTVSDFHDLSLNSIKPRGIAVDRTGLVYICSGAVIKKYNTNGTENNGYTLWDNPAAPVLYGIAVDGSGNMYATDYANNIIWKIDSGGHASVLAGTPGTAGATDGPASSALFTHPYGIAIDAQGKIYVTGELGGIRRIVYQ